MKYRFEEFKPDVFFQLHHDVICPETQVTLFKAGDVLTAEGLDWYAEQHGLEEFVGRVMYCNTKEQFDRLVSQDTF